MDADRGNNRCFGCYRADAGAELEIHGFPFCWGPLVALSQCWDRVYGQSMRACLAGSASKLRLARVVLSPPKRLPPYPQKKVFYVPPKSLRFGPLWGFAQTELRGIIGLFL